MKNINKLEKIRLITQLTTLMNAGISPSAAVKRLRQSNAIASEFLRNTASQLAAGQTFATAFSHSGLTNRFDVILLSICEQSGQLTTGLSILQKRLETRYSQLKKLKQNCFLPLGVLTIAVLATTLLTLVGGTTAQALIKLATGVSYLLGMMLFIRFIMRSSEKAAEHVFWLYWQLPSLKSVKLVRKTVEYTFYYYLNIQLQSGISALKALKALETLCKHDDYISSVRQCQHAINKGSDLTTALNGADLIFSKDLSQFLNTSEHSGSLSSGLAGYLMIKAPELEDEIDSYITWFPRGFYVLILFMAFSLF